MSANGTPALPVEEAFVITVGVPRQDKNLHCANALLALRDAGYSAAPTSDEAITALAHQINTQEPA